MKETMYLNQQIVILNYNRAYPKSPQDLVSSKEFNYFICIYLKDAHKNAPDIYKYLLQDNTCESAAYEITKLMRQMMVLELNEIESPYFTNCDLLLTFIEQLYNFWRKFQRFAIVNAGKDLAIQESQFVEVDSSFNRLIRTLYRTIEEKVQGRKNKVYRQLQAGTNATITIRNNPMHLSKTYHCLKDIPFIESMMLRTPMILHPKTNKRTGVFQEVFENPIHLFSGDADSWFCYPAKIGSMLAFIYFHRDFIASAISLGNLFELANAEECNQKPDLICLFGNEDNQAATNFYYDKEDQVWIGCVSYHSQIEYFGYIKKMCLTLHNVAQMQKGWLPIHGAFVKITLHDGNSKNIMLMGDSGAGKSETIEALKALGNDEIKQIEIIFDDMGTLHIEDGQVFGQGSEIGAFIRLDDLDPGTPYRDMDRSIFMNPESSNARVITPAASYELIAKNHKVDLFCYANNYDDKLGIKQLDTLEEMKAVCVQGKRMALGTTQEVGISTTYFANPFGPMQQQEICDPLIDKIFQVLQKNGVFMGEIYTHLGFQKDIRQGLEVAAQKLLDFIKSE